jgi:hypothetical protein
MSIALAGFHLVSGGRWERLLVCLAGFVIARLVVMRLTRPSGGSQSLSAQETRYAP